MPSNPNLKSLNRRSLYQLKRLYGGGPLSIYSNNGVATDAKTGERTVSTEVTVVRRVIILPARVSRDQVQTISQISANKAFVTGGYFDSRKRTFIIDRLDTPGLKLGEDDWFVFDGRKFEIESIQEFEFDAAWVVIAKQLVGEVPQQIHPICVDNYLDVSQAASTI